jgi:hypothetical protein
MQPVPPPFQGAVAAILGRYHRLTYSNAPGDEVPKLFKGRDGIAFCEVTAPLPRLGYEFGTTIYLYPNDERPLSAFPRFQPTDLLVLPTRPPLDDAGGTLRRRRKIIRAARTELEAAIFKVVSRYFKYCSRKRVILSAYGASRLRVKDPQMWEDIEVYEYWNGAEIQRHWVGVESIKADSRRRSTIAFFLRVNRVPGLGCGLVVSFGMNGNGTLIWNRHVRRAHPEWLSEPGFVMAEIIFRKPIPERPVTPEVFDDDSLVEVRLLT